MERADDQETCDAENKEPEMKRGQSDMQTTPHRRLKL